MMHVVKRWQIELFFDTQPDQNARKITLYIDEDIYNNMLSKLEQISFPAEPIRILIVEYKTATYNQTGVTDFSK